VSNCRCLLQCVCSRAAPELAGVCSCMCNYPHHLSAARARWRSDASCDLSELVTITARGPARHRAYCNKPREGIQIALPIIVSCLATAYPRNPSSLGRCSVCHMPAIHCRQRSRPQASTVVRSTACPYTLGLTHASPPFDTDRGIQCSQTLPQESALQLHAPPPLAFESLPCLSPPTRPSSSVSLPNASYMASPVFLESCSGG
jgi:hypothetical protein